MANRINDDVVDFCRQRLADGKGEFTMAELHAFVNTRQTAAPDSAGRILRLLRRDGIIDYEVVHRAESRYRVLEVKL